MENYDKQKVELSLRHSRQQIRNTNRQNNNFPRRSVSLVNYLKENIQNDLSIEKKINNSSQLTIDNQDQDLNWPYMTNFEKKILHSKNPVPSKENNIIQVNNFTGTWLNRDDNLKWKGQIGLEQYPINNDPDPIVIKKKPFDKITLTQGVNVRFLKPPKIQNAGDIIIKHDEPKQIPPAPPLIIRQNRSKNSTPPPLIIREEPPKSPDTIPTKIVTIPGRIMPPPPRRLIIEKMPPIPQKPQSILIERWLPYNDISRRIIYQKPSSPKHSTQPSKNIIIDWQIPDVQVTQEFKYLGIEETNPKEYRQKYAKQLHSSDKLPDFVRKLTLPQGIVFASEKPKQNIRIEGDVEALDLIDLEKFGLADLKKYLKNPKKEPDFIDLFQELLKEVFDSFDRHRDGFISKINAQDVFIHLIDHLNFKFDINHEFFKFFDNLPMNICFSDFVQIAHLIFNI